MRTSKLNMILKEEIVLGIYSWLQMTPVSMLVRNITSDQGGDYAIVRFTVDSRGGQMGPKAQGQLLCSFGFNVKESCEADTKDGPALIKAEMMNGVMQLVPECIELTDSQRQSGKRYPCLTGFVQCNSRGAWEFKVTVGERNSSPDERLQTTTLRQGDEQSALY